METYISLDLHIKEAKQAAFFLDRFIDEMGGEEFIRRNGWDENAGDVEKPDLAAFRREGGELHLYEFCSLYADAFRVSKSCAREAAKAFPQADFSLTVALSSYSSPDGRSCDITYAHGVLSSADLACDCFEKERCGECGHSFLYSPAQDRWVAAEEEAPDAVELPISVRDWYPEGKQLVCPHCGAAVFDGTADGIIIETASEAIAPRQGADLP